jgi:transcriptional regulator with XRE-family HTH domain
MLLILWNSDVSVEIRPPGQSSDTNSDLVERLREAVRRGGGNKAVAERAGIKLGSLNNYLRRVTLNVPADAIAKIAHACGVEAKWLLTGEGQMARYEVGDTTEEGQEVVATFMPFEKPPSEQLQKVLDKPQGQLFSTIDMQRMATAVSIVNEAFQKKGGRPESMREAQILSLIYDSLFHQTEREVRALVDLLISQTSST